MKFNIITKDTFNKIKHNKLDDLKNIIKSKYDGIISKIESVKSKNKLWSLLQKENFEKSVLYIQSMFRMKQAQTLTTDIKAQIIDWNVDQHENETNIIGDKVTKIPIKYLYKFDKWIFDLRELYQSYVIQNKLWNPYTNQEFPLNIQKQLIRLFERLYKNGDKLNIGDQTINQTSRLSLRFNNFYSRIEELNNYMDITTFNNLTLVEFIRLMIDFIFQPLLFNIYYEDVDRWHFKICQLFMNIPREYHSSYIINNYYENPYLNFGKDNNQINNIIDISEEEHNVFIERDKKKIIKFLNSCFDILDKILYHQEHATIFSITILELLRLRQAIIFFPSNRIRVI